MNPASAIAAACSNRLGAIQTLPVDVRAPLRRASHYVLPVSTNHISTGCQKLLPSPMCSMRTETARSFMFFRHCLSISEHPSRRLDELHLWLDFYFYRRIVRHLNFEYMFAFCSWVGPGPVHAVAGPVAIIRQTDYVRIRVWSFVRRRSRVMPLFLVPHPRGNCGDRYWCFLLSRHVILHKCHRHVCCGPARFCWPIYNWWVCNLRRCSGVPVSIPVTVCVPYRPETLDNYAAICRIL